jgi:hypothetical protein
MAQYITEGTFDSSYPPIVSKRAPRATDRAEIGTIWIDKTLNDVWVITSATGGISTWINCGGGSGTFASLTVAGTSLVGGAATFSSTITASTFGRGLVFSSAAGLLSAAAGTNGQLVIGATGASPLWASLASSDGSVGITVGANTIDLTVTGATGSSFPTDGAIVTPLAGATSIVGDTNITTDGVVANTVTINLNPSVSLVGKLTAGNDLEMTTGTCLIASDDNAANAIYLHANGGVNETIHLYSQLGTGVASLNLESLVGGIYMSAGTALSLNAATASAITIANNSFAIATGTGALNLGVDAAHTVTLGSAIAAASTVVNSGTGPLNITGLGAMTLSAVGLLKIDSSAGRIDIGTDVVAQNINIGTGAAARTISIGNSTTTSSVIIDVGTGNLDLGVTATAHATRLGSINTTSATTVQSGTGALVINGLGAVTIDAVGALELNSSTGAVNISTDAVANTTTIGNATGISSVIVNSGTGDAKFGANATDHTTVIGSVTGVSVTSVQSGTGALDVTGLGAMNIDAAGALSINSSAGVINIGDDAVAQAVNVGTGAAARVVTLGSTNGASQTIVACGTAGADFGTTANAHTTTVGSTNTTSATVVQSGTGGVSLSAAGIVTVTPATDSQAANAVTINANVGVGTFTGLTTAVGAVETLTVTNSKTSAGKGILVTLQVAGAEDAILTVHKVRTGAGSFTVKYKNDGTDALASNIIMTFWQIN